MQAQYEVLYVDKFTDMVQAAVVNDNLRRTFGLTHKNLCKLCSGEPVVIKRNLALEQAERYKTAVVNAGGVAWVQQLGPNGEHCERRQSPRRTLLDRRAVYRASSIIPDRRQSGGRRSTDRCKAH